MMQFPPSSPPPRPIVKRSRSTLGLLPPFMPSSPSGDDNDSLSPSPVPSRPTHKFSKDVSKSSIQFTSIGHHSNNYPTPLPTSSGTRPAYSSPTRSHNTNTSIADGPHTQQQQNHNENDEDNSSFLLTPTYAPVEMTRRPFQVRCPLSSVTLVRVPLSGKLVTIGRSSQSCTYALSSRNKLVSRIHVSISFKCGKHRNQKLAFKCLGWNGCTVIVPAVAGGSVGGQTDYFVPKGEELEVDYVHGITVDVRGERVLVETIDDLNEEGEETDEEMFVRAGSMSKLDVRTDVIDKECAVEEEQLAQTKAARVILPPSSPPMMPSVHEVDIEAEGALDPSHRLQINDHDLQPLHLDETKSCAKTIDSKKESADVLVATIFDEGKENVPPSQSSESQKVEVVQPQSQPHTPSRKRNASEALLDMTPAQSPAKKTLLNNEFELQHQQQQNNTIEAIAASQHNGDPNDQILHLICNHLAFSRLNSTPLSLLKKSIPKLSDVTLAELESTLLLPVVPTTPGASAVAIATSRESAVPCVGVIERCGKDAAGKPLEREFYYIPEHDDDEDRRLMVEQLKGGRSGLRACRKTHKQYFWRKPVTRRSNARK